MKVKLRRIIISPINFFVLERKRFYKKAGIEETEGEENCSKHFVSTEPAALLQLYFEREQMLVFLFNI